MPPARLPELFHWLTVQRYNKKQLFAIVCSDFVLKSAHIFYVCTENQVVTKPYNISNLKRESVSFLSKSFLSFSKSKTLFSLYKEYIYKYIYIYILYRTFFHFQNRKWQKWLWQKWQGLWMMTSQDKIYYILTANPLPKSKEIKKRRKLFLPLRYAMMIAAPGWKNERKSTLLLSLYRFYLQNMVIYP